MQLFFPLVATTINSRSALVKLPKILRNYEILPDENNSRFDYINFALCENKILFISTVSVFLNIIISCNGFAGELEMV